MEASNDDLQNDQNFKPISSEQQYVCKKAEEANLPQRIMESDGHWSSSLCQINSPSRQNIHYSSLNSASQQHAMTRNHDLPDKSTTSVKGGSKSRITEKQYRLWEQSSLQICNNEKGDKKAKQPLNDISNELRDIELGSNLNKDGDSLLYPDNSFSIEHFKGMKGLEHLAKLSIEDHELQKFRKARVA